MQEAKLVLDEFLKRSTKRYLWTDSFAIVALHRLGRDKDARELAALVEASLGVDGSVHKGMRIGKPLPERTANEPYDAEIEWERFGANT